VTQAIEPLEPRQHLSAVLVGNVLTITGTARADDIAIAAGKRSFTVHDNGVQTAFSTRAVKTIRIHALRGDDTIIVSPKLPIRCSIEAGPGHDRIGGGASNDTIFGQAGEDTLAGNGGTDYLDAGPDDDFLVDTNDGSPDAMHGGSGIDTGEYSYEKLGSGVENRVNTGPYGQLAIESEFYTRSGRTYVSISQAVTPGTVIDRIGPGRLDDGSYMVRTLIQQGAFNLEGEFERSTFDITNAEGEDLYYNQMLGTDDDPFNFILLRLA
jgi:hypothetical protein